ncbi:ATP-grasp fold amidoligase family protein [Maribacter aestuarii]|uniref:ATP-grasp fold amidoligase family protein n=1 Tax=Maribacter aestuarii TaxID=1130723 RepID=UPI00248C6E28|nr:ATP-grasp fold amidoligase family protein [Maribacter aestuarii]
MAKIIWQNLYDRAPIYTKLVDKFAVREYVTTKIGGQYLNTLYGVYENVEAIDFENLPASFVLKGTHGADMILICRDKSQFDIANAKQTMNKWLKTNFYERWGEHAYKNVPPRIICEQYLENENESAVVDYKFHCFHGEPKHIQIDRDRFINHTLNFYDHDWNRLPFGLWYPQSDEDLPKPKNLEVMVELARTLSNEFKFVRVDFYNVDGKIYFGEMTFYPCNGFGVFYPEEKDFEFGSWVELNINHEKN